MTVELRPYQLEALGAARDELRKHNSVCLVLPTGAGKTFTTAFMLKSAYERGKRSIFCVHRIELLYQTSDAFKKIGLPHGFIASGEDYNPAPLVHIAGIDTLRRRLDKVIAPDFLIVDEAQHGAAESWKAVINHWPNIKKILISATPERLDGKGLKVIADSMVVGSTSRWLIENKFLSPFRIFSTGEKPDLTGVRTQGGDYKTSDLYSAMSKSVLTGNAIDHYKLQGNDLQALIFAVNIAHSKEIAAQFNAAGILCAHLDGESPKLERENTIERFRYGEIRALSSVNLFTEGLDCPAAGCCIMLRPTKSLALYLQMIGRVLRPQDEKVAIILDHAGNVHTHGMPDIDHRWTLEGKSGRKLDKPPPLSECENCRHLWERKPAKPKICPVCGHVHEVKKNEINSEDGELTEINGDNSPWAWCRYKPLRKVMEKVTSRSDLQEIAKVKGYKAGWVHYRAQELNL